MYLHRKEKNIKMIIYILKIILLPYIKSVLSSIHSNFQKKDNYPGGFLTNALHAQEDPKAKDD